MESRRLNSCVSWRCLAARLDKQLFSGFCKTIAWHRPCRTSTTKTSFSNLVQLPSVPNSLNKRTPGSMHYPRQTSELRKSLPSSKERWNWSRESEIRIQESEVRSQEPGAWRQKWHEIRSRWDDDDHHESENENITPNRYFGPTGAKRGRFAYICNSEFCQAVASDIFTRVNPVGYF